MNWIDTMRWDTASGGECLCVREENGCHVMWYRPMQIAG